jgi:hypothetical protein
MPPATNRTVSTRRLAPGSFIPANVAGYVMAPMIDDLWNSGGLLWQDANQATPAVAMDDPVRVITDKNGVYQLVAPSDAARGLLKQGANGRKYIMLDGVDDTYQCLLSVVQPFGMWHLSALRNISGFTYQLAANSGLVLSLLAGGQASMFDGAELRVNGFLTDTNYHVIGAKYTAPGKELRKDGVLIDSNADAAGNKMGFYGNAAGILEIGSEASARYAPINWAGCVIYSANLSAGDQSALEAYMADRMPT